MKKILFIAFIVAALSAAVFVYAKISAKTDAFKAAGDFPREALFYVQIRDLPALVKLWNDSDLRRKYLESANYGAFQTNHLALKLAERAGEIESGLGVFPDLGFASSLSEQSAAFAVYDVGKMEFVFIAPVSEEKILASGLFRLRSSFEEIKLDEQTTVYVKEIDIDRARQRQKVFFTSFEGRLILATSEKYFLQTIDNIRGKTPKNRLAGEPLFRQTADRTAPHLATVWLNQEKLNGDWYFRRYWLMSELENLNDLRAGMFDFEIQDKKIVERRAFLTTARTPLPGIDAATARRLSGLIPESAQFYKIERTEKFDADEPFLDVLLDARKPSAAAMQAKSRKDYYFRDWEKSWSYSNLDEDFSTEVNESFEDEAIREKRVPKARGALAKIIDAANPQAVVRLFSPRALAPPLFFENRKALIIELQNPSNLNPNRLESELSGAAQSLLTVNNQKADLGWTDLPSDGAAARALTIPSLGWKIFYARRQSELILANSEDFLKDILAVRAEKPEAAGAFEKLTVINLQNGRETFDSIFDTIESEEDFSGDGDTSNFFNANVSSLLDVVSDVEKIEIRQTSAPNYLFEEIDFVLKENN